ncbi:MAG: TrkH family potassium uptake protein [Lachnospiraceae bacterium]|nr:TrkH family potassium uptake protein [Lachnospiraceae bacterium]
MNHKILRYIVGWLLIIEAGLMFPSLIVAVIYRERAGVSLLLTMGLCAAVGLLATMKPPENKTMRAREGFVAVSLSWIALSAFGALPFVIAGEIPSYIDALFEVVSGFTTTGSTILTDVESMSRCLLFWRSFTHWIGGMGILVFMMSILPLAGGANMYMMKAESTGPSVGKLVPKVKGTAGLLYRMYMAISVLMLVLLLIGRMPLFDALITVFGTAGTGGFGIKNDSMTSYSMYIQGVTTVFMILFGVSFNLYYLLWNKKFKSALKMAELRAYLLIILVSIVLISINIYGLGMFDSLFETVHHAAFQVATIITTTGFATTDFNLWPTFSKTILVILMFIGACAGSTGGGIKVQRILILVKSLRNELDVIVHPHHVRKMKIDGHVIENSVIRSVNIFLAAYVLIFGVSLLIVSIDNYDFTTNFTAIAATLNNIGPGLEIVGPTGNYSGFSGLSKLVMIFDMLAGRLEVFPLLILFSRSTWRK